MPRQSESERATLEIVENSPALSSIEVVRRLRAPADLTDEQKLEFQRVIEQMPAEWFTPGNLAMLVQYCRHVVTARRIAEQIEAATSGEDDEGLERLLKAQISESRIIHMLMTALRMTPQSVAPVRTSQKRLQITDSPWSGFGKKRGR